MNCKEQIHFSLLTLAVRKFCNSYLYSMWASIWSDVMWWRLNYWLFFVFPSDEGFAACGTRMEPLTPVLAESVHLGICAVQSWIILSVKAWGRGRVDGLHRGACVSLQVQGCSVLQYQPVHSAVRLHSLRLLCQVSLWTAAMQWHHVPLIIISLRASCSNVKLLAPSPSFSLQFCFVWALLGADILLRLFYS